MSAASFLTAILSDLPLREITDEEEYDRAVRALNALLDAGGAEESHPLAALAAALGEFIGDYDDRHFWTDREVSAPAIT